MKAIITCAGYASRLWPLTKETPKPLIHVKDVPITTHIVHKIMEIQEVDEIFVITNQKFYESFERWLDDSSFDLPVKIINDGTLSNDDRLGQLGDIDLVINNEKVDDDLLIVAGDNLFNFSLVDAYNVFKKTGDIVNPVWESKSYRTAKESGSVVLSEKENFFEHFLEKSPNPKSTLISLGIYFFPRNELKMIKSYVQEKNNLDKMGYFLSWLMDYKKIRGHVYFEDWFDIGWIESLEKARNNFRNHFEVSAKVRSK